MHFDNYPFSQREKEVVRLLLQGKGNKQIALELGISRRTVEFHLSNIYTKLGVNSRSEAILKLTETHLRESTGGLPVKSTVENSSDSTENGSKPILRRIAMKKLYAIIGGLSAIILVAAVIILEPSLQNPESKQPTPVELTPITNLLGISPSATHAQISTKTIAAPPETNPPANIVIPLTPSTVIPPRSSRIMLMCPIFSFRSASREEKQTLEMNISIDASEMSISTMNTAI